MKKGDLIVLLSALGLMLIIFVGYNLFLMNVGDTRFVELEVNGKMYQRIEITQQTKMDIRIEQDPSTDMIRIFNDGELVIEEKNTYELTGYDFAYNDIIIKNGGIQMLEDNSRNQDAVRKGFTSRPYDPIINLPFRVHIQIVGGEQRTDA